MSVSRRSHSKTSGREEDIVAVVVVIEDNLESQKSPNNPRRPKRRRKETKQQVNDPAVEGEVFLRILALSQTTSAVVTSRRSGSQGGGGRTCPNRAGWVAVVSRCCSHEHVAVTTGRSEPATASLLEEGVRAWRWQRTDGGRTEEEISRGMEI